MAEMFNPAHPERVLREWLGEMQVKEAAARLHVSRVTLSRILNCKAGISAEMSLRLSDALEPVLRYGSICKPSMTCGAPAASADPRSRFSTATRRELILAMGAWRWIL
ncbi:MAG TPA: HigA family addiction module antitoxin [Terracidiphilus sp.]|nr:HigA family addiction module antitoxin [Terracidiphilus sp.]